MGVAVGGLTGVDVAVCGGRSLVGMTCTMLKMSLISSSRSNRKSKPGARLSGLKTGNPLAKRASVTRKTFVFHWPDPVMLTLPASFSPETLS